MENEMPRSNGVYSEPAGTKGTPNTTIQSAPYNSFVDDLVADNNAPRPITAGGTGATSATAARAALGADNADNLTQGTVADARLPITQTGKTFTGTLTVNGAANYQTQVAAGSIEISSPIGAFIDFKDVASEDYDIRVQQISNYLSIQAAGGLKVNGSGVWTAANDGAGSGMDADLLDGQQGSFYQDAGNLNAGRVPPARLTGTYTIDINGNAATANSAASAGTATTANNANTVGNKGISYTALADTIPLRGADAGLEVGALYVRNGSASFGNYYYDGNITGTIWGGGSLSDFIANGLAAKAGWSASTNQNELVFPIGQVLGAVNSNQNRRALVNLYLAANTLDYTPIPGGTQLSGSWRQCGRLADGNCIYQRVA